MALHVIGLFCEDIREEKNGQITIVGILPDNLNIAPPPPNSPKANALIPKLGIYLRLRIELEDDPGPMSVKLLLPDGKELPLGDMQKELIETSQKEAKDKGLPFGGIVFHAVMQGFQIPVPGLFLAALDTKDQRYLCAILNILQEQPSPLSS